MSLDTVLACSFHAALKRLHRLIQSERFEPEFLLVRRIERFRRDRQVSGAVLHATILVDWTSCGLFDLLVDAVALKEEDRRPGQAMLLYAEAHRKDPSPETRTVSNRSFFGGYGRPVLLASRPEVRRRLAESGCNRLILLNPLRRAHFLAPEILQELKAHPRCL